MMRNIRLLFPCILLMIPWQLATANRPTDNALAIIKSCYDESVNLSNDFTPCVTKKLKIMPNAEDFQLIMNFKTDEKGTNERIPVFMVDKTGYMYYCIVTTGKTLIINACAGEQGKTVDARSNIIHRST